MAVTKGHGNPNWSREETILALDLYFALEGEIPGEDHSKVTELSGYLRSMPLHDRAARRLSFRNPAGVVFKLENLRQVATGKGLPNTSKTDRAVWAEFGHRRTVLTSVAMDIRRSNELLAHSPETGEGLDDAEFLEGATATKLHSVRERNRSLRKAVLRHRRKNGGLRCEVCDSQPLSPAAAEDDAIFEVHHDALPTSAGERRTKLSDIRLLCANCHRHLHRLIATQRRWIYVCELQSKSIESTKI